MKSIKKTNIKRLLKEGSASIVEAMKLTSNSRDPVNHEIQDPSERLLAIVGACNNEPRFYPTDPGVMTREYKYDTSDFDPQAQLVINTAMEVAESNSPKDLLQIAHWARTDMRMRTIPQVLLAVAAHCKETKQYVRQYAPKIIRRADELKQVFVAYRALFGHTHSLPNCLKRGLADSFTEFKALDFLKYEGKDRPHFSDVLKMVDRKKDYPLSSDLAHYLSTGEVKNPDVLPEIYARQQLTKLKEFNEEAIQLAKKSHANWEVLLSQFGNTKAVWEHLISTEQLGYMAMLRNLKNILLADVSSKTVAVVCAKLVKGAKDSKQLPYRFLSAVTVLEAEIPVSHTREAVIEALSGALKEIGDTIASFPGTTLIAIDTSGSMQSPVSEKSKISAVTAAATLGAMAFQNSGEGSVLSQFASSFAPYKGLKDLSTLGIVKHIEQSIGTVGHGTNAQTVLNWALVNKKKFDRIMIFSDMQTSSTFSNHLARYRKEVNPNCYLHSFDLRGYGTSLSEQKDTKSNLIAGYSERLLDTVLGFEGLNSENKEEKGEQTFTLEYVRKTF